MKDVFLSLRGVRSLRAGISPASMQPHCSTHQLAKMGIVVRPEPFIFLNISARKQISLKITVKHSSPNPPRKCAQLKWT